MFQVLLGAIQQLAGGYQAFGGMPGMGMPGMGMPGMGMPGMGMPGMGMPGMGMPGMGMPGMGMPGMGMPGGFPQLGFPPMGLPSFGFPAQPGFGGFPGFPQPGYPQQPPFGYYPSPGTPQPPGGPTPAPPNNNLDFTQLNKVERTNLTGLNDPQRAVLHLWGIQVTSEGKNDGGIYFNVLNNPQNFTEAEVDLVRNLYNQEMAMFGGVNGKLLDQHFFGVFQQMTGEDISHRYANAPVEFANGPINMDNRLTGNNGLSSFDSTVIRLWGHDILDNGAMDGSVTEFTLNSAFALDKLDGSLGSISQAEVEALLAADLADGVRDGNALEMAFVDSLDAIYFGAPGASVERTFANAGINQNTANAIIEDWAKNPPPGIPPGVDISDMSKIGNCPVMGPAVTQQGGGGGIQFGYN